jgi:hypothetical protein
VVDLLDDRPGEPGRDMELVSPTFPECSVAPDPVALGGLATVQVSGLPANGPVHVVFGDRQVASGSTDAGGEALVDFPVPAGARVGTHLVTVGVDGTALTADCIVETVRRQVVYEYAAKIVCGIQPDPEDMRLVRGFYATSINVHNPDIERVRFTKKLALTIPPGGQRPGEVRRLAIDALGPDEALAVDCMDIKRRVFPDGFPQPYIEGFVIIQSPRSLDVTAVYTTASLDKQGRIEGHTSTDIEQIRERIKRIEVSLADLVPLPPLPAPSDVGLPEGFPGVLFCLENPRGGPSASCTVTVRNQGTARAQESMTAVEFTSWRGEPLGTVEMQTPALDPGQEETLVFAIPNGCYGGSSTNCSFRFIVDADSQVAELDEGNNTASSFCSTPAG